MAKKEVVTENVLEEKIEWERREVYPTGFRNIDTSIGYRIYDEKGDLLVTNRGILSGSWITSAGVSHSGKSTLMVQILANMARRFMREDSYDPRVKIYILDVENGMHRARFMELTGFSDLQVSRHVRWIDDNSIEGLQKIVSDTIRTKEDKAYKLDKRIGSQGREVEIYPPTFIFVDAISELVSDDVLDVDKDATNTLYMRQNLMLDQFVKKNKVKFAKLNINVLAIAHTAKKMNMDNPMAKPLREWKGLPADIKINGGKAIQYASDLMFYLNKILHRDSKTADEKGGRHLEASSSLEAIMLKNRQGLDNTIFYLVSDRKGRFDPLSSFILECKQNKITESAGPTTKIPGTEFNCRTQDLKDKIINDVEFRNALFGKYDEFKDDQLESQHTTQEERQRQKDILDIMML